MSGEVMPAVVSVKIQAGVYGVEVEAQSLVEVERRKEGDSAPLVVAREESLRNAGEVTMAAALDAMFSTHGMVAEDAVAEAYVEEPTTLETQTAQDLRERIDAALAWLVVSTSGQITGESREHLIDLLHGRA